MSSGMGSRLVVGLVLFLLPWTGPASTDAIPERRPEDLRIETLLRAGNPEAALQASERSRARDLLAHLEKPGADVVGVTAIQLQLLDGDTILLEYLLGESKSFLSAVTSTSLSVHELPSRTVIDPLARELRESLIQSRQPAQHARAELVANRLSAILLAPIAKQLARKSRLAVVLDGSLQGVPFAVLPEPEDMRVPLLLRHEIVELPSASVLAALRRRHASRPPPTKTLAILADPVFSSDDPRITRADRVTAHSTSLDTSRDASPDAAKLTRLPFSEREAQDIAALVPKREVLTALGFEASRELAMSPELGRYRILHFAAHAIQNRSAPERSGIVLSQFDRTGRRQEGFLEAGAIWSLDLPADLVVLSACQTALGREADSDGFISLSQGFLAAGAHRVVASLWPVSDAATARLMTHFYQGLLQEKLPPATALRRAQMAMLKEARWRSPFYWGGFVLQGDWR